MWLSTLQLAWSFLFYCGVTLIFITAIGACKKLSQDKGKTYAHLSAAVAANAPQWRAALADNTPLPAADDDSGRRRREDDSSSYETEDEAEERRERARERERERERQKAVEREKERERGREEKEREKRRRGEESDETDRSVGVHRRRRRPLSAGGGEEEAEDEHQLVLLKGSSSSSDEQLLDGYSTSPDTPSSPTSPHPFSSSSAASTHLPLLLAARSLHSSSASSSRASALGPVILPSPDVLAYRELVRVVHSAWREGLLRSQRTLMATLIEREKERGRLTDIAATVLSRVIAMYETRRRRVSDKEGEGGEVDEADVMADVYSLLQAGERREANEASDASAIVSSIRAAATLAAASAEQDKEGAQSDVEQEAEEVGFNGELNLTLQRLLSLPLPPPPVPLELPVEHLPLSLSESAVPPVTPLPPLPPLPTPPAFDPVVLANRYLSDSHTARTTVTQQLCTDRPDTSTTNQLASRSLPLNNLSSSSLSSSQSPLTLPCTSGMPVLHPVYAVPALQTRYLNVELLNEMELVMYGVQKCMEQLVTDKLNIWIRRDEPPAVQPQPPQRIEVVHPTADKREAGEAPVRTSTAPTMASFTSPQPPHRTATTPSPSLSASALSPGAPPPSAIHHSVSLPAAPPAVHKSVSAADNVAAHDHHTFAAPPPASTPARSRALSFAERHAAGTASPQSVSSKQIRKQSSTATRTSTPATPHSTSTSSATYYHTSPPFTPNHHHHTVTAPVPSHGRSSQTHSPYHSSTSPSTISVPVLPPRPPSSGGSPPTQRARATGGYKRENGGSPGVMYATDGMVNGTGKYGKSVSSSGSASRGREEKPPSLKHLRSKSLIGYGTGLPYSRDST